MDVFVKIMAFIAATVVQGTPLLFGAVGEIITEKSGNLNLGIPGIMYIGGISGIIGGYLYEHFCAEPIPILCVIISLLASLVGSAFIAFIYSFLTITLKANQNVVGLALTTLGVGLGNFYGGSLLKFFGEDGSISLYITGNAYKTKIPFLSDHLGIFGETFFSFGFLVYLAIFIAILSQWIINRTRVGLNLRAIGENPATADAAGINVSLYKYVATCVGGAIAGLGGLYFVMDYTTGAWTNNGFGDRGWLAIAIVIFALWKPRSAILSSYIFGGLYIASVFISGLSGSTKELIKMLPYLVTIIVLVFTSSRKKREHQPPAALGQSYFREER
ncbi:MAG: ABC transporter permease [Clostridia bacterium]|nr:ABC transporter permease [Clostridia bacterium]